MSPKLRRQLYAGLLAAIVLNILIMVEFGMNPANIASIFVCGVAIGIVAARG